MPLTNPPAAAGSGAPTDAKYIVQTANADLSAEQALDALATGLLKNTTATGILSIAAAGTDYSAASHTHPESDVTNLVSDLGAKAPTASPSFTGTVTLPTGLTGVLRADSGVVAVDTDVTDLVTAGTDTTQGKLELATPAEVLTGTDTARAITAAGAFGAFFKTINVQSFVAPGAATYTPTAGMKWCIAIVTGGGGGGGGADTAGASGDTGAGAGGGAGGTAIGFFSAATVGASKALSIGATGSAGSATNGTNGGNGGDSTWNTTTLVGTGGALGTGSGASAADVSAPAGGLGGVPTGGTINITGGSGDYGMAGSSDGTTDITMGYGGKGGASFWGGGGRSPAASLAVLTTDADIAGGAGLAYGAGGSGAISLNSTTGAGGGLGMSGIIMVIEFI